MGVSEGKKILQGHNLGWLWLKKAPEVIQDFILYLLEHPQANQAKPKSLPCPKIWSLQTGFCLVLVILFVYMDIKIKITFRFPHSSRAAPVFPQGWLSTYLTSSILGLRLDGL